MTAELERKKDQLLEIANGFAYTCAIATGVEFGLFDYLDAQAGAKLEAIASDLKVPPISMRALLLGLCHVKLLARGADGGYRNGELAELLVTTNKENVIPLVRAFHRIQYRGLYHMPEALRAGDNIGADEPTSGGKEETLYKRIAHDPELESIFHGAMHCFTIQTNRYLIEQEEWKHVRHVLDVGGGSGTNSVALMKAHPQLRATVFDAPTMCKRAEARFKEEGVAERGGTASGDFFDTPFPSGIDAILYSHVAEIYSPEQVQFVCKKAFDSLPSGGRLIFWTISANDDETGGHWATKISLYFLTQASGKGITYPPSDHERWMKEAGFSTVKVKSGIPWEHAFIVGVKA